MFLSALDEGRVVKGRSRLTELRFFVVFGMGLSLELGEFQFKCVGRVGLWCPQVDESLLGLLGGISGMEPHTCTTVGSTYRTDAEGPRRDLFHSA